MGYIVKVSLKKQLRNPLFCVVCGSNNNLHPTGYFVLGRTNQLYMNYSGSFFFPVCGNCSMIYRTISEKRKRFRSQEEKEFLKLYDKEAVTCHLSYHPLLGIKWASFRFHRKDYAEAYARINSDAFL